ncbi:MAG: S1C family serine protease [Acidimicrobiia bacterium]
MVVDSDGRPTTDGGDDRPGTGRTAGDPSPSPTATSAQSDEPELSELFQRVRSGVVRIRASTCAGTGAGTGFLIGSQRVATAAHVVDGAVAISVETVHGAQAATVEAIDVEADLASLRLAGPDPGHVFTFATEDPQPGTRVAAIGYPLDGPLSVTEGTVSGIDRVIETYEGDDIRGLLQTDAAINPGSSGGPLIVASGEVAGIASGTFEGYEGLGFAVESSIAAPWFASSVGESVLPPLECATPLGPEVTEDIGPVVEADWAVRVAETFALYFGGINVGDYETAWRQLSPRLGATTGLEEFAAGVRTSYDFGFTVRDASHTGGRAEVWLEFISVQHPDLGPEPGQSCTFWSLDYVLVEQPDGRFLIDEATGHGGSSGHRPCG